jgi:hypothetical protein
LSPAPQAEPQADGFSSGLSEAPQAEPQAAGFSSFLSEAPQAEPQADAGAAFFSLFHPNRLKSAIVFYLPLSIQSAVLLSVFIFYENFSTPQVRTFLLGYSPFGNYPTFSGFSANIKL